MTDILMLVTYFDVYRTRLREVRRGDTGASGIETAIITAVLAGIAITLTVVIVNRIRGQAACIEGGVEDCGQGGGGAPTAP